jgi:hypothetical protein
MKPEAVRTARSTLLRQTQAQQLRDINLHTAVSSDHLRHHPVSIEVSLPVHSVRYKQNHSKIKDQLLATLSLTRALYTKTL